MDTVVNRLLELGGRNMSEPCAASLLATIMFTVGCKGLDDSSIHKLLQFFKLDYKRKARRCPKVDPYLKGLPLPEELMQQWPALYYKSVFGNEHPVHSQVDVSALPTVHCRSSNKSVSEIVRIEREWGMSETSGLPMDLLQRVVTMQQSQLELMLANRNPSGLRAGLQLQDLARPAPLPTTNRLALPAPSGLGRPSMWGIGHPEQQVVGSVDVDSQTVQPLQDDVQANAMPLSQVATASTPTHLGLVYNSAGCDSIGGRRGARGARTTEHPIELGLG